MTAGYAEPSIAFLLGTNTGLEDGPTAGRTAAVAGGLALVAADQQTAFLAAIESAGARANPLEEIEGLNYSRGLETKITLYRVVPAAK